MVNPAVIAGICLALSIVFIQADAARYTYYDGSDDTISIKAWMETNVQKQRDYTIFINACEGKYNPDCRYGTHRHVAEYADITVTISEYDKYTDQKTTFVEQYDLQASERGVANLPVLIDEKYKPHAQYIVEISGNGDTESLYFWTHQKHY